MASVPSLAALAGGVCQRLPWVCAQRLCLCEGKVRSAAGSDVGSLLPDPLCNFSSPVMLLTRFNIYVSTIVSYVEQFVSLAEDDLAALLRTFSADFMSLSEPQRSA